MNPLFPAFTVSYRVITLLLAGMAVAQAGDTRTVLEPVIPQSCGMLRAQDAADSTRIIQNALTGCTKGKTLHLSASAGHAIFYSGPLRVPSGVSLAVDDGVTLKALADPSLFDNGSRTCGTLDHQGKGCNPFIWIKKASGSGIYGQGTIDGQGDATMTGKQQTWWQLATEAKNQNLKQNAPRLIQIDDSTDITLYQITLKNSPNFHVVSDHTNGLTLWGITIDTPAGARNTDGVDPMGSQNVTLIHSRISTGDDNVAIKAGNAASSHLSIVNNQFGFGHGLSIGSEINKGVSDVTVRNLIFNGTTNGLRIKSDRSRGGRVSGVTYDNICMVRVKNPILLDTHYDAGAEGNMIPVFSDISFRHIQVVTPGHFSFDGYDESSQNRVTLQDVHIQKGSVWRAQHTLFDGKAAKDAGTTCDLSTSAGHA